MKKVVVAVGVIVNEQGDILIAKRHEHLHQGGKWEFPGGKVEAGEDTITALTRELSEEVAIEVSKAQPMMLLEHDYGDKFVRLDIWKVEDFTGIAQSNEGQEIRWVSVNELTNYQFPEANGPIVDKLIEQQD